MQFGLSTISTIFLSASLASAQSCSAPLLAASRYKVDTTVIKNVDTNQARNPNGFSVTWNNQNLQGLVRFTTSNNKVQYNLNLVNGLTLSYKIALAIYNDGVLANWIAVEAPRDDSRSGCYETDISLLNNPKTSYKVQVVL